MKWTQVLATGFSTIGLFASTTHGSVVPLSGASASVVLEDVQSLTNRSEGLQEVVKMVNPSTVYSSGMNAVKGLGNIATDLTANLKNWKPSTDSVCIKSAPFTDPADAKPICTAFREFVHVHQVLLNLIIGKQSVFAQTPVLAQMAAALRAIEVIVDAVAFFLIGALPPCSAGVKEDQVKISGTLRDANDAYSSPFVTTTWVQVLRESL